jgi:hypothetical protein
MKIKIKKSITLSCSGCEGQATFTPEGAHPTLFHTLPVCEHFNRVVSTDGLIEYMHECGRKRDQKEMS